ncbi:hypothetical protein H5404_18205 [Vibrio parahaemolyticus]|uniref:hypothetical protein n=1 Tax=Vibrio parahaemolyticus TaxID=670 RepID=UPI0016287226|nr:hypothetical protein [Vibrio parahaemolyticus]QNE57755.1 hypothetical protein H5404_18205 [Vibrio parahaemolyticus]
MIKQLFIKLQERKRKNESRKLKAKLKQLLNDEKQKLEDRKKQKITQRKLRKNLKKNKVNLRVQVNRAKERFAQNSKVTLLHLYIALAAFLGYGLSFILESIEYTLDYSQFDLLKVLPIVLCLMMFISVNNTAVQEFSKDSVPSYKLKTAMIFGSISSWLFVSQVVQYFDLTIYNEYITIVLLFSLIVTNKRLKNVFDEFQNTNSEIELRADEINESLKGNATS